MARESRMPILPLTRKVGFLPHPARTDELVCRYQQRVTLTSEGGAIGYNSSAEEGTHGEPVCAQGQECTNTPNINDPYVGLLEALVSVGDVKATFSGHGQSS